MVLMVAVCELIRQPNTLSKDSKYARKRKKHAFGMYNSLAQHKVNDKIKKKM